MRAATTVFLVRHASHDRVGDTLCGRIAGVRLGAAGQAQSRALAGFLAAQRITALLSSPMERARDTAAPVAEQTGLAVRIDAGFNEIDVGEWAGQRFDALAGDARWTEWNHRRATARAPGGESMAEVQQRALAALAQLVADHPGGRVAVVSHCDVIKAVLAAHLGMSLNDYMRFEIDPASVSTLAVWPQDGDLRGKILSLNIHPDMPSQAAAA
ncbi:histidine phosphatase family protein [Roseomonas elaeocarpi]|uniref:Histidine phosphatase family protein n=1 Tax=Roseomonas elaeocarpi TaxID=907779 RepID=A0ABV6JYD3_9PROT